MENENAEEPDVPKKRPTLDDPEELKLIHDIYMDPSHPLLGEAGWEALQRRATRERQRKITPR